MTNDEISKALKVPFSDAQLEWKPQTIGVKNGKPYARILAYVDARALQERLDAVVGMDGWWTTYRPFMAGAENGAICTLSVIFGTKAITKEDGCPASDIEPLKGAISGAFKRVCASGFGMGRDLYALGETWADCTLEQPPYGDKAWNRCHDKASNITFWWKAPLIRGQSAETAKSKPKAEPKPKPIAPALVVPTPTAAPAPVVSSPDQHPHPWLDAISQDERFKQNIRDRGLTMGELDAVWKQVGGKMETFRKNILATSPVMERK